ncbi:DUF1801 domain-containing protein [Arcanobacterium ihumii]|uniref:DUF1801 domain-containing protein n=1 Tax=Arcanobacterium ihumii TaxID=2138162 RepID=UPI000F543675|nr:DUF1801 domain-containing protein [Arcanobacterium ihumii]
MAATTKKPALNPTEAKERIDSYLKGVQDWRSEVLAQVRSWINEADPQVIEQWKWMGSPVWENNGNYIVGNMHKDKVKLTFSHGAHLHDPNQVFNNGLDGKEWRAIDIREGMSLNSAGRRLGEDEFKELIRAAVEYNRVAVEQRKKKRSSTATRVSDS